jgi:predicted RNA polymerase sigma factor
LLIYTKPGAWLVTTARHRAIDRLRRDRVLADKLRLLAAEEPGEETPPRGYGRATPGRPPRSDDVTAIIDLAQWAALPK